MIVKICGVTGVEDALACVEAGADAIGFNLWPRSKRHVTLDALRAIAPSVRGRVERFGVFVDPTEDEVRAALDADLIDVAQLHGDEDPAFCERFAGRVVKALRLAGAWSLDELARYGCARFLVDAPFAGYGGSGQLVDDALARAAVERAHGLGRRVILAGGLTAANVASVIERVAPDGVDVASGVETAPGRKDHDAVRRFVAAAKAAHASRARQARCGEDAEEDAEEGAEED
jgi:phosphoribosylanthranilate isomerase